VTDLVRASEAYAASVKAMNAALNLVEELEKRLAFVREETGRPFKVNSLAHVRHIGTGTLLVQKKFSVISPRNIQSGNTGLIQAISSVVQTLTANFNMTFSRQKLTRRQRITFARTNFSTMQLVRLDTRVTRLQLTGLTT
jgi:hypothetical protein